MSNIKFIKPLFDPVYFKHLFDTQYTHSVATENGRDTIFLIANCIENTIDEFNV